MNELLKAYIDGELPVAKMREVEEALKRDPSLRNEFDQLRRLSSTFRESAVAPVAVGLDKTLAALKTVKPVKRPPLLRFAPAVGLAFATCLAFVAIGTWRGGREPKFNDEIPTTSHRKKAHAGSNRQEALNNMADSSTNDDTIVAQAPADMAVAPAPRVVEEKAQASFGGGATFSKYAANVSVGAGKDEAQGTFLDSSSSPAAKAAQGLQKDQKQIVKTGQLTLTVKDGKATAQAVTNIATRVGGYIESSNLTGDDEQGMTGTITVRLPVTKFDQTMTELQKMGKVSAVSSDGQDVTAAVADDDARLTAMKAQEQSYLKILNQAKHIDDVLAVKDRIDSVQQEIESLSAELKTLRKQAAMSTINVTINQKPAQKKVAAVGPVKDNWAGRTWSNAFAGLASAGKTLGQALIFFVVFCPIWIPLFVLANVLTRRLRTAA